MRQQQKDWKWPASPRDIVRLPLTLPRTALPFEEEPDLEARVDQGEEADDLVVDEEIEEESVGPETRDSTAFSPKTLLLFLELGAFLRPAADLRRALAVAAELLGSTLTWSGMLLVSECLRPPR